MVQHVLTLTNVSSATEDVLRHVQTMLDHLSVVAKMDTLFQAMDTHAMVCTDCTNHSYKCLCFFQLRLLVVHVQHNRI